MIDPTVGKWMPQTCGFPELSLLLNLPEDEIARIAAAGIFVPCEDEPGAYWTLQSLQAYIRHMRALGDRPTISAGQQFARAVSSTGRLIARRLRRG